jgi:NADH dehydrogenase (ubiquinone) 1 beta subcomplex subunit 8
MYSMWGPDAPSIPARTALFQFGIAASVFLTIALFAKASAPERDSVPREYPFSGLVKELGGLEENKVRYI